MALVSGTTEEKYPRSLYERNQASDEVLQEWASDPNTVNREECAESLSDRRNSAARKQERLSKKRQALQEDPFDPRTEVSADARKIVRALWIMFVLLPFVVGVLFLILSSIK